jgi:regulatory protein
MMPRTPQQPRVRKPKQVTEERLFNAAIYYLERFSATAAHVKTILQRKVKRWTETEPDWAIGADEKIDKAIARIIALGYINDAVFAESRVRSLRRKGTSTTIIKQHLAQKGVRDASLLSSSLEKADTDFVQENRSGLDFDDIDNPSEEAELQALQRFIKRKRLFQSDAPEQRQKDIAKVLRGGFRWDVVKKLGY